MIKYFLEMLHQVQVNNKKERTIAIESKSTICFEVKGKHK